MPSGAYRPRRAASTVLIPKSRQNASASAGFHADVWA
jgi:hypothetical protein